MSELIVIKDEEEPQLPESDYLKMLAYRLSGLIEVLRRIKMPAVAHYCRLVANTMEALSPFYSMDGVLPRGFVDQDDSGFPCTEDLMFLFSEWSSAERGLAHGPDEADLLARMRERIYSGEYPGEEQASLARRRHLATLRGAEIAEEFRLLFPIVVKETESLRFYKLGWRGWDDRAGVFRYFSSFFTQDKFTRPLEEIKKGTPAYQRIESEFQRPLHEALEAVRFREGIHPKSVDRCTIGPYYVPGPDNSPFVRELLHDLEQPFILKFTLERVIVESSPFRGTLLHELAGPEGRHPVSLVEQRSRYVLCSPELRERLGGTDEKGEAATVFTLERGGKIA